MALWLLRGSVLYTMMTQFVFPHSRLLARVAQHIETNYHLCSGFENSENLPIYENLFVRFCLAVCVCAVCFSVISLTHTHTRMHVCECMHVQLWDIGVVFVHWSLSLSGQEGSWPLHSPFCMSRALYCLWIRFSRETGWNLKPIYAWNVVGGSVWRVWHNCGAPSSTQSPNGALYRIGLRRPKFCNNPECYI